MGKCHNCDQYDYTTHNCPIFCDVIRNTLDDIRADERKKTIEEYTQKIRPLVDKAIETMEVSYVYEITRVIAEQLKE